MIPAKQKHMNYTKEMILKMSRQEDTGKKRPFLVKLNGEKTPIEVAHMSYMTDGETMILLDEHSTRIDIESIDKITFKD
jgi:hypothetical protein